MKKNNEIYLGNGDHINIKKASIVTTHNTLQLITPTDGIIETDVKIEVDFNTIPEKYHEVFFNMLSLFQFFTS